MEKGQIIESGTHLKLLNQGGTYAKLWEIQSDRIPEAIKQA